MPLRFEPLTSRIVTTMESKFDYMRPGTSGTGTENPGTVPSLAHPCMRRNVQNGIFMNFKKIQKFQIKDSSVLKWWSYFWARGLSHTQNSIFRNLYFNFRAISVIVRWKVDFGKWLKKLKFHENGSLASKISRPSNVKI